MVLKRGEAEGVVARGRHRPRAGRCPRPSPRDVVDRLLPVARRSLRHRQRVPRARLPDPRDRRGAGARGDRARRDAARRRPRRRLRRRRGRRRAAPRSILHVPRRDVRTRGRVRRPPRNVRAYSLAMQRAGVELGAHRVPRADARIRRRSDRRRDAGRDDRHGARPAHRRARSATSGSSSARASSSAPCATRSPSRSRTTRSTSSASRWSSRTRSASTGDSRRAGCCSGCPTRTSAGPARRWTGPTCARWSADASVRAGHRRPGHPEGLGGDDRILPGSSPRGGSGSDDEGDVIGGVTVATAVGHGMM